MRYLIVLIALLLPSAVAVALPRQAPVPPQCPVAVDDTVKSSPCSDQCECGCNEGHPCTCAAKSAKTVKTHVGKDGRLWTWSEDEGGHFWAWKAQARQAVVAPVYQPYRQSAPPGYGQPVYQPSFAPSYQPSYQGHSEALSCVGGR